MWEYTPPGHPVTCQRLPNGNTFVATYNELVEVDRDKTVVFSAKVPTMMVYCARKLRNGHYIYVSSGDHLVELDSGGEASYSPSNSTTPGAGRVSNRLPTATFSSRCTVRKK